MKPYLASSASTEEPINSDNAKKDENTPEEGGEENLSVQKNIYNLLASQSWGKETQSTTALAGSVMVSVMSGSTSANRYFQVLVPVTNDKRDFALLNYIVKTNESGKILACTYTGALQGYSDLNTYYKKVADLLNGNTVRDDRGKYSTKENAEDFNHHSTEE